MDPEMVQLIKYIVFKIQTGVTRRCPGQYIKVIKCILQLMPGVVFDLGYWGYPALPGLVHKSNKVYFAINARCGF